MTDSALDRRDGVRRSAAEMGIDEAYVSTLVETFYGRIRAHPELGPIFEGVVGGRWDHHLARMKAFWSSVALASGTYSGRPIPAHMKLSGLEPAHFRAWLGLFREVLEETAPSPEAATLFMLRAGRIAESLQLALFGVPELRPAGPAVGRG